MGRPKSDNPTNHVLQIRTHKHLALRLKAVAVLNRRSVAQEALLAIERHLDEEENALRLKTKGVRYADSAREKSILNEDQKKSVS